MRRRDWLLLLGLALLCLAGLLFYVFHDREVGTEAEVYVDGVKVWHCRLNEDGSYRYEGEEGYNLVCIEQGKVCVKEADCVNQSCVKQGCISRTGESIVCLPHRLTVQIRGEDLTDAFDGIVR